MKAVLVLVILSIVALTQAAFIESLPVLDDSMINEVNAGNGGWIAGRNPRFEGMTMDEARQLLGAVPFPPPDARISRIPVSNDIPTEFDARKQWASCIHKIRDQGQCGSCWAFGATESLEDRLCIAGGENVVLGEQTMVSCDTSDYGCQGGYLQNAWSFLEKTGVTTEACQKYVSGSGSVPSCKKTCDDGSKPKYYMVVKGSSKTVSSESQMQEAIMTKGPVEASFSVYQDFFAYKSGVYRHKSGGLAGGHAIKVLGWGVDSGTKYWICANSWGTSWGQSGIFWILRGTDECGIEDNAVFGDPKLN
jgi:cathepsin B